MAVGWLTATYLPFVFSCFHLMRVHTHTRTHAQTLSVCLSVLSVAPHAPPTELTHTNRQIPHVLFNPENCPDGKASVNDLLPRSLPDILLSIINIPRLGNIASSLRLVYIC